MRERGFEMGEELDGDDVGAEAAGGSSGEGGVDEDGGQFTIADEDDSDDDEGEDEGGDISGAGDEGARAFKAVVGNPPKSNSKETPTEIQDPLQSASNDSQGPEEKENKEETIPCLIDRLFSCTIDLLFCAGFTVPESVKGLDGDKINVSLDVISIFFTPSIFSSPRLASSICSVSRTKTRLKKNSADLQYVIWEKGVGSTVNVGSSAELDRNKTEVLRTSLFLLFHNRETTNP